MQGNNQEEKTTPQENKCSCTLTPTTRNELPRKPLKRGDKTKRYYHHGRTSTTEGLAYLAAGLFLAAVVAAATLITTAYALHALTT